MPYNNKIWVVTGPVFKDNFGKIGPNEVTVPGYFYKVVFNGKEQMIGFVVPQKASKETPFKSTMEEHLGLKSLFSFLIKKLYTNLQKTHTIWMKDST